MRILNEYLSPVIALAISCDGSRLYTAAQGQVQVWVWDVATGKVLLKFSPDNFSSRRVTALACSPVADCCAVVTDLGPVQVCKSDGSKVQHLLSSVPGSDLGSHALAFHPAGTHLAAGLFVRGAGTVGFQTWDLSTTAASAWGAGDGVAILALTYSPCGKRILTAGEVGVARLWNAKTGKVLQSFTHENNPTCVAFRPDGTEFATGHGWKVSVWSVATGERRALLTGHNGSVPAVTYSPDGKYLASVAHDGAVILRDAQTLEQVGARNLGIGKCRVAVWLPDGQLAVGGDGPIAICEPQELLVQERVLKPGEGEPLSLAGHKDRIQCLAYAPDGQTLASFSRTRIHFWDLSQGAGNARELTFLVRPEEDLCQLSWSSDGGFCLVEENRVRMLDARTLKPLREIQNKTRILKAGAGPEGHLVLVYLPSRDFFYCELFSSQGTSVAKLRCPHPFGESETMQILFAPRSVERIYFRDSDRVYLWTTASGNFVSLVEQSTYLAGMAISPDERYLATIGGQSVRICSLPTASKHVELRHRHLVSGVDFLTDGRLITACLDKIVRFWDPASGKELLALDPGMGKLFCLAVSPDGMTFALGAEKKHRIVLMDVPD